MQEGSTRIQLSVELQSKWNALNTCRNADLLVTYRNNSEKPVMIIYPEYLHLEFRKGKQVVTKFDGFTYEISIYLWGIILAPKSVYCTKIPLRLFLKTKKIVPGEWSVSAKHGGVFEKEWVGSEFGGRICYVRGKNVKSRDKIYETSIASDEETDRYHLLIRKDHAQCDRIEIITDTLVSNSTKLVVERCGWMEKFLWKIKVWFSQF